MLTIYLARHGEAEGNAEKKLIGQSDSLLTLLGKEEAEKLGEKLRSVKFDKIYSSDLKRALETASIISEALSLPLRPEKTEKLREIDAGECCGMEVRCFSREYPESKSAIDFCFPQGESYKQFYERIVDFVEGLKNKHKNKIILIVAHAGVIKAIECHFGCLDFCDHSKKHISHRYIKKFVIDKS